jgi:predicted secreted protein
MTNNVSNVAGEFLVLQLGNGATPEVFTATATINTTRTLDMTAIASVTELADTVSPSNPAITYRQIKSYDLKFSGSGIADAPSILAIMQWLQSGAQKNAKVIQNRTGAQGGFTVAVPLVITSFQLAGVRGDMQTFTATFEAAGAFTITANA